MKSLIDKAASELIGEVRVLSTDDPRYEQSRYKDIYAPINVIPRIRDLQEKLKDLEDILRTKSNHVWGEMVPVLTFVEDSIFEANKVLKTLENNNE